MFKKIIRQLLFLFTASCLIILITTGFVLAKKEQTQATIWNIYSTMSRGDIQNIVDIASDGDTIFFHTGVYDWSGADIWYRFENKGAISIIDKTLTIKGEEGTVIIGPDSINGTEVNAYGLNAFYIRNSDATKDVTFENLNIKNFLRGIAVCNYVVIVPIENEYYLPCVINVKVKDCAFLDIHRDAISLMNIRGNILIQNNDINVHRVGVFVDWYWSKDHKFWQSSNSLVEIIENKIKTSNKYYGLVIRQSKNVFIENNLIDDSRIGMSLYGSKKVLISENSIYANYIGIWLYYSKKGAIIDSNYLSNCRAGIGISGKWIDGEKFEAEGAVIEKNKLYFIKRTGIGCYGDACSGNTISKNEINMIPNTDSLAGIYTKGHHNYFGHNRVKGSGLTAIMVDCGGYHDEHGNPVILWCGHNEIFQANNIAQFSADWCHFYLNWSTHDVVVNGSSLGHITFIDRGYNNRITGMTPMTGGIGKDLSEAIKRRNEELKEAREIEF